MSKLLTGYCRHSTAQGTIKVSINQQAMKDCETYTTSDGQTYVALHIDRLALEKVLRGERAVTTIYQEVNE